MDVYAPLGGGVTSCDIVGDGCWGGLGGLLEGDGAGDLGVTAEDCDCEAKGSAGHTAWIVLSE